VDGGLFRKPEVESTAPLGPLPDAVSPRLSAAAWINATAPRADEPAAETPAPAPRAARVERPERAEPPARAERAARPPPRQADAERARVEDDLAAEVQLLRRSVDETRRALAAVTRSTRAGHEMQLPPAAADLYARLAARGVEHVLAEELVRQALAAAPTRRDALAGVVRDLLGERLVPARAPWRSERVQTVAVVGPTGVGKTTTLAKIAARALIEGKKRVAFLTVDTTASARPSSSRATARS
jgi:flagellar biosynthesis protein FlhF